MNKLVRNITICVMIPFLVMLRIITEPFIIMYTIYKKNASLALALLTKSPKWLTKVYSFFLLSTLKKHEPYFYFYAVGKYCNDTDLEKELLKHGSLKDLCQHLRRLDRRWLEGENRIAILLRRSYRGWGGLAMSTTRRAMRLNSDWTLRVVADYVKNCVLEDPEIGLPNTLMEAYLIVYGGV